MAIKFVDVKCEHIFKNLNLEIKTNEITSIVGKNGSGKTRFLNLIFGLDLNFSGKIVIGKKNICDKMKRLNLEKLRADIFYLSQTYQNQLFNVNALEDIKYDIPNFDMIKLDELLKSFCLDREILKKNYSELSNGEMKKILLISMFIGNKKIILLDDPTSDLDQKSISTLIKLLKKAKRDGKMIIITSQNSEFLLSVSDKILILDNGNLMEQKNKYDFFSNSELLNKCGLTMPNVLQFRQKVLERKNIKLVYRDNINDLIKDIYRSAK